MHRFASGKTAKILVAGVVGIAVAAAFMGPASASDHLRLRRTTIQCVAAPCNPPVPTHRSQHPKPGPIVCITAPCTTAVPEKPKTSPVPMITVPPKFETTTTTVITAPKPDLPDTPIMRTTKRESSIAATTVSVASVEPTDSTVGDADTVEIGTACVMVRDGASEGCD